jgi:DNA invertase Pin-like site-specific DNA recombinase
MTAIEYCRVGTEDQAKEGVILGNQKLKKEAYCQLKDLDLTEIIEDTGYQCQEPKEARRSELRRDVHL